MVDALVGQLPFQMGSFAIDRLLEVRQSQEAGTGLPFNDAIFPTSFLDVVNIPQDLLKIVIDMNYLGNWVILGYTFLGVILALGELPYLITMCVHLQPISPDSISFT